MIPSYVNIDHLDSGIKPLILSLGRIPNIETMTNCEGHIYRELDLMPTKGGWVYFLRVPEEHNKLIHGIELYCNDHCYFDTHSILSANSSRQTIDGLFEPYEDKGWNNLFIQMNKNQQEAYFQRAEVRKQELLKGWSELNQVTLDYIKNNITKDIDSLPYQNKDDGARPLTMCGAW
jgi:hypothetical protein